MINKRLSPPKNQSAFILHCLLNKDGLTEREAGCNGYRMRIHELITDHKAPIQVRRIPFTNRFNRPSKVNQHFILPEDQQMALEIYYKVNKSEVA